MDGFNSGPVDKVMIIGNGECEAMVVKLYCVLDQRVVTYASSEIMVVFVIVAVV